MNNIEFSQILEQVCLEEYTAPDNAPVHHFSFRHRRNMRRILAMPFSCPEPARKLKLNRRTLCILIAAIFLALLTVSGAAYYISTFIMKEHRDNTQLFAFDIAGAPETIEQEYYLSVLPEGYKEVGHIVNDCISYIKYQNSDETDEIILYQNVKKYFNGHYNTEGCFFEEVKIGEYSGVYIDWGKEGVDYGSVIWADDDYVLELYGNLTKDELLYWANGTKSLGK